MYKRVSQWPIATCELPTPLPPGSIARLISERNNACSSIRGNPAGKVSEDSHEPISKSRQAHHIVPEEPREISGMLLGDTVGFPKEIREEIGKE